MYFPFQLFQYQNLPFVFENGVFQGRLCANGNYRYQPNTQSTYQINTNCSDLQLSPFFLRIFDRIETQNKHVNHIYLNFIQLTNKIEYYAEKYNTSKLNTLNLERTLCVLRNKNEDRADNSVIITDVLATVLLSQRDNCKFLALFSVSKITVDNEYRQSVPLDLMDQALFCGNILQLNNWDSNSIYWEGLYHEQG